MVPTSTHDITPQLEQLLSDLHRERGKRLPWLNFAHPGDPAAYPLVGLLPSLVDKNNQYLDVKDVLVHPTGLLGYLAQLACQTMFALIDAVGAHSSYWYRKEIASSLSQIISETYVS